MHAIGIDVGGTHTRVAVVDPDARVLAARRFLTPRDDSPEAFVRLLAEHVNELIHEVVPKPNPAPAIPVGLAVPGILDESRTAILRAVNLPNLEGYPLAAELARLTRCPVSLIADADAATWGECLALNRQSTSENRHSFVHLRLGTGIALGWVTDGHLQPIEPNRTGHLSVLVVDDSADAARCRCGKTGCLDTVASGHALIERARNLGFERSLADLEGAHSRAHPGAKALVAEAARALAKAIIKITDGLQPKVISLGGGVLGQLSSLQSEALKQLGNLNSEVVSAKLADDAGLVGAALLANERKQTQGVSGA